MIIMRWINCYFTQLARRIVRSFLFFLCLFSAGPGPYAALGQTPHTTLNTDSLNYYLQLVEQGERQVGEAFSKIGFLYFESGKFNSALRYFDQALPLLNGENRSKEVADIHEVKGVIYGIFGDNAQPRRYYRLAENQFTKSLNIYTEIGAKGGALRAYKKLSEISAKRGNFASAVVYQNKVIDGLERLYRDSLQAQADSFNDLLNKEIESSKDTILINEPVTASDANNAPKLFSGKNIALALLSLLLLLVAGNWWSLRNKQGELESKLQRRDYAKEQLNEELSDLQMVNLALSKTEKQQRNSNLTKDKIFSIISHDIRSPINTISGFLNILGVKLKSIGDIELKALANEMEESTSRLSQFLDDLLKWSMSQMGKLEPQPERIDMQDIVQQNYKLVESRLKSKNIQFKIDINENVQVYADANMLNLVLRNLISNAIKFTRQGGYIAVGLAQKDAEQALLFVADDGIGISEDDLLKLFEFEGSSINGIPENKGAGLGLILCKEFVELNGGEISAVSKIGEGTRFEVLLPTNPGVFNHL